MSRAKWRKPAAAVLALTLVAAVLPGCGVTDAGFASLYMETANLRSYEVSGGFEMAIDPQAMYYYSDEEDSQVRLKCSVSGEIAGSNIYDMYMDLKIRYGINSEDTPYEANLRLYNNVVYMPVKDCVDIQIETHRLEGKSDEMCESLRGAFMDAAGEYDYVIVGDMSEIYREASFSGAPLLISAGLMEDQEELQKLIVRTVSEMFSGLETGMTRSVPGGYSIGVTPEKAINFFSKFVKYVSEHRDAVFKGVLKIIGELRKYDETGIMEGAVDRESFDEFIDGMVDYTTQSDWDYEYAKLLFRDSYLNMSLTKQGKEYVQSIDMDLHYRGKPLMSLKGDIKAAVRNDIKQEPAPTGDPILMDDLSALMNRAERTINYVRKAEIKWWNGSYDNDEDSGVRSVYVDLELVAGSDWDYADCIDDYGTLYLPMRQVCEWFGEEVIWDGEAKKAYVVRGEEKIEMTGKLEHKTTFVKVRDFEKLGYTVEYKHNADDFYEHQVTITGDRNGI